VETAAPSTLCSESAALLEALPDATAVLDRVGTIVAVNTAWRMFALDNGGSPEATGVGVSYVRSANVLRTQAAWRPRRS
jgi:hypothetical protein